MSEGTLAEVWRYPVKSLGGEQLSGTVFVGPLGIIYDRQFGVLDVEKERLCSLKTPDYRQLGAVRASMINEDGQLHLEHPEHGELIVEPLIGHGDRRNIGVLDDQTSGVDQGDEAATYLTEYLALGRSFRLVRTAIGHERAVDPNYLNIRHYTSFSDGYPLTLHTVQAAAAVAAAVGGEFVPGSHQWRSNLVINAPGDAFALDYWRQLRIARVSLDLPKASTRCIMTELYETKDGVIQHVGGTLQALRDLGRAGFNGTVKTPKPLFAQNAVVLEEGSLSDGDNVILAFADDLPNWTVDQAA